MRGGRDYASQATKFSPDKVSKEKFQSEKEEKSGEEKEKEEEEGKGGTRKVGTFPTAWTAPPPRPANGLSWPEGQLA